MMSFVKIEISTPLCVWRFQNRSFLGKILTRKKKYLQQCGKNAIFFKGAGIPRLLQMPRFSIAWFNAAIWRIQQSVFSNALRKGDVICAKIEGLLVDRDRILGVKIFNKLMKDSTNWWIISLKNWWVEPSVFVCSEGNRSHLACTCVAKSNFLTA